MTKQKLEQIKARCDSYKCIHKKCDSKGTVEIGNNATGWFQDQCEYCGWNQPDARLPDLIAFIEELVGVVETIDLDEVCACGFLEGFVYKAKAEDCCKIATRKRKAQAILDKYRGEEG